MFGSVLVANRGEIACRVFRTARRMGLETIAVFSDADARAAHVRAADRSFPIGPAVAAESYLAADRVLAAAKAAGAEAVHPGYGFLSENADFAQAVIDAGLVWVGPPPAAIRAMGLKDAAKRLAAGAGVPVTPGYLGDDQSSARLKAEASDIGFPVLIKAVAGGGGKGMRLVSHASEFDAALAACRREAAASFGDDRVLLETWIPRPRHIEVQVFGDSRGEVVHLFERDCSLQRRHQKVIEEAPAPGMSDEVRAAATDAAIRVAKAVGYVGAGTVEFIADASQGLRADRLWFMEMNTRLQVEHPVTEMVTGLDLVEWQLRVAAGEPLPLRQDGIVLRGHAVEARLYAEIPSAGFLPSTGRLEVFDLPSSVRADAGVEAEDAVAPFYDPMIAKLVAWAPGRDQAIADLSQALGEVAVWPVKTNAGFLVRCLEAPDFIAGAVDTGLVERDLTTLAAPPEPSPEAVAAAGWAFRERAVLQARQDGATPWDQLAGFRLNAPPVGTVRLFLDGRSVDAPMSRELSRRVRLVGDEQAVVFEHGEAFVFRGAPPVPVGEAGADGLVRAPMPGRITTLLVAVGDRVGRGQALLALEAMKMEHTLTAPFDAVVTELRVAVADQVVEGAALALLEPAAAAEPPPSKEVA